jgi:hypothetical protein
LLEAVSPLAIRYKKLAVSQVAMYTLAAILIWVQRCKQALIVVLPGT